MKKAIYTDIDLNFVPNPNTGDIIVTTNAAAIRRSFKNLILTNFFEVPFRPDMGTNIHGSLFENFSPMNIEFLKAKIRELAETYEPRVKIHSIVVNQLEDFNHLEVKIQYPIIELNRMDAITTFVGRTR